MVSGGRRGSQGRGVVLPRRDAGSAAGFDR